ncbi:MAG: DUF2059 domain-containing protein [Mastigocoleus sp.]
MKLKLFIPVVLLSTGTIFNQAALAENYVNRNPVVANASNTAKIVNIRRLLEVSGVKSMIPNLLNQTIVKERTANPDIPQEYWDAVSEEIRPDELLEAMVPIYDKYFSNAEIRQMIAFYSTPVAKKITSKYPQILEKFTGESRIEASDYKKYFTDEEIEYLNAFENSRVGKKLTEVSSQMQKDLYEAGSKVGIEAAKRAVDKIINQNSSVY